MISKLLKTGEESIIKWQPAGDLFRVELRPGQQPAGAHGERNEWRFEKFHAGDKAIIGYALILPDDFHYGSSDWFYNCQMHKDGDMGGWGGPAWGQAISPSGHFKMKGRTGSAPMPNSHQTFSQEIDAATKGTRHHLVQDAVFSPTHGRLITHVNGHANTIEADGPTMYQDGSNVFPKFGLYRNNASFTSIFYLSWPVVGDSVEEVMAYLASLKSPAGLPTYQGQTPDPGPVDPPPVDPGPVDPPPVPDPEPIDAVALVAAIKKTVYNQSLTGGEARRKVRTQITQAGY